MSLTFTGVESEVPVAVRPRPPARRFFGYRVVAVVALATVGLFAAHVWFQGGTRLELAGAGLGVHPVAVGRAVSFGVEMTTRGGPSVVVEAASSEHSAGIRVQYAIVRRGPQEPGIGTADGTIPGATALGTHGIRVAQSAPPSVSEVACTVPPAGSNVQSTCTQPPARPQPERGSTWLVVTVTATRPGPWSVTHIAVRYHSWWRTRSAVSAYVVSGQAPAADVGALAGGSAGG